eukprot:3801462-Pleurochrysis_carterae.AAC.1
MREVDACAAGAVAGGLAADAGACACVLFGVDSTDKTETRHKMQTNLRAASCREMNARARVSSVAGRTCAGRWLDIRSSVS